VAPGRTVRAGGTTLAGGLSVAGVVVGAAGRGLVVGAGAGSVGCVTVPLSVKSRSCGGPTALPAGGVAGAVVLAVLAVLVVVDCAASGAPPDSATSARPNP
jgi:hypothetical protein